VTAILEPIGPRLGQAPVLSPRQRRVALWAIAAALLLHIAIAIICIIDWAALLNLALTQAEVADAIPVTLVYVPPPPPPPPPPKPQVQPEPPPPQPITPRMSGPEEKTEAKAEDTPLPALPQPKSPPEAQPQQKKPVPVHPGNREPATVAPTSPAEREAALMPEPRKQAPPGPLFRSIRLPSRHGGTGERDTAGDPYLNRMKDMVERHRIYPPASAFPGGAERLAVYDILVDPSGELVQMILHVPSGSSLADEAAGAMIRNAAPFPPLPADWPHFRTSITVELPIYPQSP
jgi:TonB family protein